MSPVLTVRPQALFRRVALEQVELTDGTTIPQGTEVNIPNLHMQEDAKLYPNPTKFDGYRYLNLREKDGSASRYQFVTTGYDSLGFGHGIHGCPGRFFASNEIKLMLAHLIMKFDWKFCDGKRPEHSMVAEQTVLDHHVQVLYRSRTSEVAFV